MTRAHIAAQLMPDLFTGIGNPTPESSARLRKMQEQMMAQPPSNSFYLTTQTSPVPTISWSHNLEAHLGVKSLSMIDYFELIHPQWWMTYLLFGKAAYQVSMDYQDLLVTTNSSYQIKIPLRVAPQQYTWFNQVSLPGEWDDNNMLCSHLNIYQYDRPYNSEFLLTGPLVTFGSHRHQELVSAIQQKAEQHFYTTYFAQLRPNARHVLFLYRKLAIDHSNFEINSQLVASSSALITPDRSISRATVEKRNQDILSAVRHVSVTTHTPLMSFPTVKHMAHFLNSLFGPPTHPF